MYSISRKFGEDGMELQRDSILGMLFPTKTLTIEDISAQFLRLYGRHSSARDVAAALAELESGQLVENTPAGLFRLTPAGIAEYADPN